MEKKVSVRIDLTYKIGDSPVPHKEVFETKILWDVYRKIGDYKTNAKTLQSMFGHMVPGLITGGSAQLLDEPQNNTVDKEAIYKSNSKSIWRSPYWLIPFRLIWKIFAGLVKFIWEATINAGNR